MIFATPSNLPLLCANKKPTHCAIFGKNGSNLERVKERQEIEQISFSKKLKFSSNNILQKSQRFSSYPTAKLMRRSHHIFLFIRHLKEERKLTEMSEQSKTEMPRFLMHLYIERLHFLFHKSSHNVPHVTWVPTGALGSISVLCIYTLHKALRRRCGGRHSA